MCLSLRGQLIHPYTKGRLRFSDEEITKLSEKLILSTQNQDIPLPSHQEFASVQPGRRQKIIFDTDLGSDIDDSLALLAALHLQSDLEILGITTVYGHVRLRTKLSQLIVEGYDKRVNSTTIPSIPVIQGEGKPLGTQKGIWHTDTEGCTADMALLSWDEIQNLKQPEEPEKKYQAAKFIIEQVEKYPKEVTIILLGASTNLALALSLKPSISSLIQHVVFMAMGDRMDHTVLTKWEHQPFPIPTKQEKPVPGKVYSFFPGHNTNCDLVAAIKILNTENLKVSFIGNAVTTKNWFSGPNCQKLVECAKNGEGEMKVVGLLMEEWLAYRSGIFNTQVDGTCPHDVLAVLEGVYPGKYVEYLNGWVVVHEWAGFQSFVVDPKGPHRIGVQHLDPRGFLDFIGDVMLRTQ